MIDLLKAIRAHFYRMIAKITGWSLKGKQVALIIEDHPVQDFIGKRFCGEVCTITHGIRTEGEAKRGWDEAICAIVRLHSAVAYNSQQYTHMIIHPRYEWENVNDLIFPISVTVYIHLAKSEAIPDKLQWRDIWAIGVVRKTKGVLDSAT